MEKFDREEIVLSQSLEDYLETIHTLQSRNRVARVKDIAEACHVRAPSVTGALKVLKGHGLILHQKNSYIQLTEKGMTTALSIKGRHEALLRFLSDVLLIPPDQAETTACRIEHQITPEIAERLMQLTAHIGSTIDRSNLERILRKR